MTTRDYFTDPPYSQCIFTKKGGNIGYLDGEKLHLEGTDFYLTGSRKIIPGWRCYGIEGTNWRFLCKIYDSKIRFSVKSDCKYNKFDLVLMDIVVRLGNEFKFDGMFV